MGRGREDFYRPSRSTVGFFAPMDFLVARYAQTFEIALVIRAAVGDWFDVMYQHSHRRFAKPKAHLAEWMHRYVAVADFLPSTAVPFVLIVATGKMLIMPCHQFVMLIAITAPLVRKIGTATKAAGAFGFLRHRFHLVLGMKKPPQGFLPRRSVYTFLWYTIPCQVLGGKRS